uniref:Uncharacterized protein n=1 Tax=Eptatretus burgeri TaxID=7764 RepID=A0A8C4WX46_EPTBU
MPRKKPFSIKQKKKQLQDKRERKRGKLPGGGSSSQSRNGSHERPAQFSDTSDTDAPSVRKMNEQPNAARPTEGYDPNRWDIFHSLTKIRDEIERRKRVSREHVLRLVSEKELEVDVDEIYRPGSVKESRLNLCENEWADATVQKIDEVRSFPGCAGRHRFTHTFCTYF